MDDKLILSVFNFPELYNVTLPNYRCTESRINAWRNISNVMCLPTDECKKKWKNLRDRYLKEVRIELKSRQQGEMVPSRWKFRQLLNFLAPFTGSRNGIAENYSNNDEDNDNPDNESVNTDGDSMSSEMVKRPQAIAKTPGFQPESKSQVAIVAQLPSISPEYQTTQLAVLTKMPSGTQLTTLSNPGKKRPFTRGAVSLPCSDTIVNPKRMAREEASFTSRPQDEDELFLLSFVPALKRLAPQKRCETKMRIQQIMYEAEFNVPGPRLQDKTKEPGSQE